MINLETSVGRGEVYGFASFPLTVKCLLNPPRVQGKAQRREMVIPFQEVATQQWILKTMQFAS